MMNKFLYALGLGLILLVPAVGFSDQAPGNTETGAAERSEKREIEEVEGEIEAIDLQAKTIRLEPGILGLEKELTVTDQTKIIVNGQPGNIGQLREGDEVKVHYAETENDLRTAEYIEVLG